MEETFQLTRCEKVQPIYKNDKDVLETVVQVSSAEEDLDLNFIRVFAYNFDGEVEPCNYNIESEQPYPFFNNLIH